MNKKGFTLIEIIAVIIIIGVLLIIAVPAVTKNIMDSRDASYVTSINKYIEAARNEVTAFEYNVSRTDTTYYIPTKCLAVENGDTSPYGEMEESYVVVTTETDGSHTYYYVGRDSTDHGMTLTRSDEVSTDKLKSDLKKIDTNVAVEGKPSIKIYDPIGCGSVPPVPPVVAGTECGPTTGESTVWTSANRTITVRCIGNCKRESYSMTFNRTTKTGIIKIESNDGKIVECRVNVYVDKGDRIATISATKRVAHTEVPDGVLSNEGLDFTITGTESLESGTNLYYCKDLTDTCDPNQLVQNGRLITKYETVEGIYYIRYKAKGGNGSESDTYSYTAKVDTTRPEVRSAVGVKVGAQTLVESDTWSDEYLNYRFNIYRGGIGEVKLYYCRDTSNSCTPTDNYNGRTDLTAYNTVDGQYFVRYKAVKETGKESEIGSYTAKIDRVVPSVSITATQNNTGAAEISSGNWSTVGLNFTITQELVGESGAIIMYCQDTDNTCTPTSLTLSGSSITSYSSTQGTFYIRYVTISGTGLSSTVGSYTARVDSDPPTCTLVVTTGTLKPGTTSTYLTDIGIGFGTHTDNTGGSGVDSYGIGSVTGDQTTTVNVNAASTILTGNIIDNAGNTNTCSITVTKDSRLTVTLDKGSGTTDGTTSVTAYYNSATISPATISLATKSCTISGFGLDESRKSDGATVSSTASISSTATANGYYTASSGGSKVLDGSTTAAWTASVTSYTDANNKWINTAGTTLYAQYGSYASKTLPTITKTPGYTCGWTTSSAGTTIQYASGGTITPTGDTTLYGVCTANPYQVTFNVNGGKAWTAATCVTPSVFTASGAKCKKTVKYDKKYATLPVPERDGYNFAGWYTAATGGTKVNKSTYMTTAADHTLYAHWTQEPSETNWSYVWCDNGRLSTTGRPTDSSCGDTDAGGYGIGNGLDPPGDNDKCINGDPSSNFIIQRTNGCESLCQKAGQNTGVTVKDWHCSYSWAGSMPNGDAGYCWCEW